MERKWREKRRLEQRASDCHFLLNFAQDILPKKEDKFAIFERLLDILEIPIAETMVYGVSPEEKEKLKNPQKKLQLLQELVKKSPNLMLPLPISTVIAYKNKTQQIMISDIDSIRAFILEKLQFLKQAFQPIVEVARFIATNRGSFILNFYWLSKRSSKVAPNPDIQGYFQEGSFTPFFIRGSIDFDSSAFHSGELVMLCKRKKVIKEVQGFSAYCLWRFIYFILPGLSPARFALCEVCQRVMYKLKERDKYCSRACSQKAYRMRKKQEEKEKEKQEEGEG